MESLSSEVLLLGAGYTLKRLAVKLGPENVILSTRNPDSLGKFQDQGFTVRKLDVGDKASIEALFEEFSSIKTIVDSVPPTYPRPLTPDVDLDSSLKGVKNLCSVLKEVKAERLFYLSTSGVYGAEDGEWVTEESICNPNNPRGKARLESEKLYAALNIKLTAFRIAAIYGPGRGIGNVIKRGNYSLIDDGSTWSNRIHVDDIVRALSAAISSKEDLPAAINLADDMPRLSSDVAKLYCDKFNFEYPSTISLDEARAQGKFTMLSNQRVSNALLKEILLPQLKFPTIEQGAGEEFKEDVFFRPNTGAA